MSSHSIAMRRGIGWVLCSCALVAQAWGADRPRGVEVTLLAASGMAVARAQDLVVNFDDAVRLTLAANPRWQRFALEREAADARRAQADVAPALEVGATAEGVLGSGDYRATDGAELMVSLGSVFERAGKRGARVAVQQQALQLLQVEQRIEALDLLAETGRRFIDVAVAQERLRLAVLALEQADATVSLVSPRVAAARSSKIELLNAQVRQTSSRLARSAAERELEAAQVALAAQWADREARPRVAVDLLQTPAPAPFDALERRLDAVPDLARFASEAALREAQRQLARSQSVTDWRWSVGVRRFEASGDQALVLGWSMPLDAARRAAPYEREARANAAIVDQQAAAARLALRPVLFEQRQLLETLHERVTTLGDEDLARAREALELTERGYRIGRFPFRELALAQAQLIDLQLQRLEAAAQYHLTRLEIDRLTGAQVSLLPETRP